jgi:hypothetical protein
VQLSAPSTETDRTKSKSPWTYFELDFELMTESHLGHAEQGPGIDRRRRGCAQERRLRAAVCELAGPYRGLGSYARHYYDLYQLSDKPEVLAMLKSDQSQASRRTTTWSAELTSRKATFLRTKELRAERCALSALGVGRGYWCRVRSAVSTALLWTVPDLAGGEGSLSGNPRTLVVRKRVHAPIFFRKLF